MEDNRFIIHILIISILIFPFSVFSYGQNTTHPALTNETINFFNLHYPSLGLDKKETELVVKGSVDEDHGIRPMHHFYDPVYERGLILPLEWQSSKEWAMDTKNQVGILKKRTAGTINSLFSANSDYSWDRAIYDYVWGDRERGLEGLGHILHLIQDATVPDHTRNDPHPPLLELGSPYESWTGEFDIENTNIVSKIMNKKPVILSSIIDYFNEVANYSNNNFFSKDTIFIDEYSQPLIKFSRDEILNDGETYKFGYGIIKNESFRIVRIYEDILFRTRKPKYFIEDPDNLILSDYWNLLSKQAVLYGAGVVKLFFDEVEKERESKRLYKKNRNWFKRTYDSIEGKIFGISKSLYGSSVNYKDLDDPIERARSNTTSAALTGENGAPNNHIKTTIIIEEDIIPKDIKTTFEDDVVEKFDALDEEDFDEIKQETIIANDKDSFDEKDVDDKNYKPTLSPEPIQIPGGYTPGFGGGGGGSSKSDSSSPIPPNAPAISSPSSFNTEFATTTITFVGTADSNSVISQNFSTSTVSVADDGSWSLTLSNLPQGTTTLSFFSTKDSLVSSTTSIDVGIDTIAPSFNTFEILQCEYSLNTGACLSGSTTINLSWTSSSDDIALFKVYKDSFIQESLTGTSTTLSLSDGDSVSIKVSVTDDAGNTATSSSQTVNVSTMPVVINEIAWAGTEAGSGDEWIELYNRTSDTIDLSNVKIVSSDEVPFINLSGTIGGSSYYLIERTDDSATNVTADLTTSFSGVGGGSGLSNSQETLNLIHSLGGQASTTLDSTPDSSSCGGTWCAGTTDSNPKTMERINTDISGSSASNWESNNTFTKNGTDADGNDLNGTPRAQNSVNIPPIGYYCDPQTSSFVSGNYYLPTNTNCFYLSSEITGKRYGISYLGVVASSTQINSHFLGLSTNKNEPDDYSSLNNGDDIFIAIFKVRDNPDFDDVVDFDSFFRTGSPAPPHLDYGVLDWKYGVSP